MKYTQVYIGVWGNCLCLGVEKAYVGNEIVQIDALDSFKDFPYWTILLKCCMFFACGPSKRHACVTSLAHLESIKTHASTPCPLFTEQIHAIKLAFSCPTIASF
jgi:hypothetical protein